MTFFKYAWPLLVALVGGFITGIILTIGGIQKVKILQKISLIGLIIISIVAGVVISFGITLYGNEITKKIFVRKVRIVQDIDLEKDCYYGTEKTLLRGTIKKGSTAIRTFAKGRSQYLTFNTVVDSGYVELIEE